MIRARTTGTRGHKCQNLTVIQKDSSPVCKLNEEFLNLNSLLCMTVLFDVCLVTEEVSKGIRVPGSGVTDSSELPCGRWD